MKTFQLLLFLLFSQFAAKAQTDGLVLSYDLANKLAQLPLSCIEMEYPNKLNQVLTDSVFLGSPKNLHPVFYGCFDWHSAVHGHWLLAVAMNRFPDSDLAKEIIFLFDKQFTKEKIAAELAYFEPKLEKSFERTYGWAWLLKLHEELIKSPLDEEHGWSKNLQPLTHFMVESFKSFLPKLVYPLRDGQHTNTAFSFSLALSYARAVQDSVFEEILIQRSLDYYGSDCGCPISWEPSGADFISPCLQEAELMSNVLEPDEFENWLKKFLPELFKKKFTLEPGKVLDRTDGKLVHLDGLNFSRAWCFYEMGAALPRYQEKFKELGDQHIRASMFYVTGSDYMGSHWLASFFALALEKRNFADPVEHNGLD